MTGGGSERFWLDRPVPSEVTEALRTGLVLDIGCGSLKQLGTVGVDQRAVPGVDVVCDFERGLPFKTDSVRAAYSIHSVEHMRDLITFMVDLYRVCAPGARVYIKTPYYTSCKAFLDPTHVRFMTEESFEYFKSPNYYGLPTNFRTVAIEFGMRKPFAYLPAYVQKRARRYLWNVCEEMTVILEAVKP